MSRNGFFGDWNTVLRLDQPEPVSKPFFAALLQAFAREVGAGRERIIVLQIDNAGWHSPENLPVPNGIRLVCQPPYTPEVQPAEHLWQLVDEPIVNRHIASLKDLEAIATARYCALVDDPATIASTTNFNWWPRPPSSS